MNIKQNYKKIIGTSLIINILVICLSVMLVLSQATNTFTITSGIYPSASSYTVYEEDSTYYAKSAYGAIGYSGLNEDDVIQSAIDRVNTEGGGTVYIKQGSYYPEKTINLSSRVRLVGEVTTTSATGLRGTIFFANADPVFQSKTVAPETRVDNCEISNIGIIHSGDPKTNIGIYMNLARFWKIENVYMRGLSVGINITNGGFWNLIEQCNIEYCGIGILFSKAVGNANSNTVFKSQITNCDVGLEFYGGTGNEAIDSDLSSNTIGVKFNEGIRHKVTLCRLENNDVAVNVSGTAYSNSLTLNLFTGNTVNLNGSFGVDSWIRYNSGFITENAGNISITTGATVSHGLAETPTVVILTISVSEDVWATAIGNVTFTVNFDGGGTQTVYWYAEYQP